MYEVCLTVSNENSENTSCQTLYLGVTSTYETEKQELDLSLFPNPVRSQLRLTFHNYLPRSATLSLYSLDGHLVLSQHELRQVSLMDVSKLVSGTYIYEIREEGNLMRTGKIIKVD